MTSDRIQRNIERLLDEADQAFAARDWLRLGDCARDVLSLDPENREAQSFLGAAERNLTQTSVSSTPLSPEPLIVQPESPQSFAGGRYEVKRFLGEGGKKRVYLAHDTLLDRDVAFALIKTEGLDDTGRDRIRREAQAMGRLGSHPHIVSVFDLGEEADGQPFIVTELMAGGDVEGLIEKAPEHRPPLERSLEVAIQVCRGLEFAHSHGIVHRDLKPGNVWLTADGTAKLGDFGLAVALDRSRLTQAGMMVGTVSYMPPEQAMGGEVTPRSDLYSLGSMLYELVTGRPPFVGDEAVAIISQHLNTPPVSPSWHNPLTPPTLEALILRLLEKDPSKRPASAADVLQALGGIQRAMRAPDAGTGLSSASIGAEAATAENPLYRRTFVGRESELHTLQVAYDAALSGQGGLVMVVGEPGIGKTSLTEQLATYASIRGGRTLVGHCYEEGSLSLPYLPFVEAMRSYVLAREPDGLKADLGSGAADVARIISEIRDRMPVDLRDAGDPDDDRWRLLQAVSAFLRNASSVQPLVIVLEDLHDADRGTLDLLTHLARNLQGARLLLVGTYRDVEVDRSHPLSGTLAELRRGQNFSRVPLRGLTAEEVQRMMAGVAQQEVPWPMAEVVHRQTEGNPLFVQEMLRFLVEEGLVERREGSLRRVGEETLAGRIPEGLRDVIGKRLSRLSEPTNQALAVASVIGREFRLDVLQRVAGLPEEALEAALKEAMGISIVEERASSGAIVTYRFTHAFFRQTLYEETIAPRRIRLHQQVARALEEIYGRRLEEHAAELAEHYAYSSDPADLAKAVEYGALAAQRALGVYAYGEAVRHLEQALKVQEVLDPDDKTKRCDLLLALGEALLLTGKEPASVSEIGEEILGLAEALGDRARAGVACKLVINSINRYGAGAMRGTTILRTWTERADRYADPGTLARVYADIALARTHDDEPREARALNLKALHLARNLGDAEALFNAAFPLLYLSAAPRRQLEQLELAREFSARSTEGVKSRTVGLLLWSRAQVHLDWGDRETAEELWRKLNEVAQSTRDPNLLVRPLFDAAVLALLDGQLEAALAQTEKLASYAEELGVPIFGRLYGTIAAYRPLLYLGRAQEVLDLFPRVFQAAGSGRTTNPRGLPAARAVALAHLERTEEARQILTDLLDDMVEEGSEWPGQVGVKLLEVAALVQDKDAARRLRDWVREMAPLSSLRVDFTTPARHLGAASALLGEREQAHTYYEQALEAAGKIRFRPELALTHLQIAELLLDAANGAGAGKARAEALEHLDFAIAEFREMKMQPSLERALRHKEVLKA